MWKFVTRGIRETLERRASCRTNVYSQTSTTDGGCASKSEVKPNLAREQKFLAPNVVASCNSGFCGSAKTGGPKDKKYDSKWDTGRSWSEAVGWSSVLAVGWVVCQSLCLRKRLLFERSPKEDKWHNRLLRFHGAPLSFIDTFDLQPRHVLPVTNCVADCRIDISEDDTKREWTNPRPYGPITVEEALKEAKDDYTRTHRLVMGEFELRFGVKALEEKRYKDALKHFSTGASLSSSGSMFNLGLCHELGIGTVTDTTKAAKYYGNAAEKGHPDAMYNLGVFHAQGRGGLSLDLSKARELFTEAASLGQVQAREALDLEKNDGALVNKETVTFESPERMSFISQQVPRTESLTRTLERENSEDRSSNELLDESSSSKISHYDESRSFDEIEAVANATDIFLSSLGIRTNPRPIFVGASDF